MKTTLASLLLGIGCLLLFGDALRAAAPPSPPVAVLIADLGAEGYEVREAATRCLMRRLDAEPQLRAALKRDNLEVRRRAERVLQHFARHYLRSAAALMKAGRCDLAIDLLLQWGGAGNEAVLPEACELARLLAARVKSTYKDAVLLRDLPTYVLDYKAFSDRPTPFPVRFSREPLRAGHFTRGFTGVACAPAVRLDGSWSIAIVLAGERVEQMPNPERRPKHDGISESLILSNGSVKLGAVFKSVVIAAGAVELEDSLRDSLVIAGGPVTLANTSAMSVVITGSTARLRDEHSQWADKTKENEPNPLGLVRFFHPRQVGVEVVSGGGRVVVSALAPGKEFAAAGVRIGDAVTALGGSEVKTAEAFRRVLRLHAAQLSPFTLTLERDGKKRTARVALKE